MIGATRRGTDRRPFIAVGSIVAACGLSAVALGQGTSFLVLTLAGTVAYIGVNVVMTAHRSLVHDCFDPGSYAQGNGALEVATLLGGLAGLPRGGLLTALALWAPFVLAAVGMLLFALPTLWWLPVGHPGESERPPSWPLRFYATAMIRPGVRALLAAEILWVIGYAALPVFFILYARRVLGLEPGSRPSGLPPSHSARGRSWSQRASSGTLASTSHYWRWA